MIIYLEQPRVYFDSWYPGASVSKPSHWDRLRQYIIIRNTRISDAFLALLRRHMFFRGDPSLINAICWARFIVFWLVHIDSHSPSPHPRHHATHTALQSSRSPTCEVSLWGSWYMFVGLWDVISTCKKTLVFIEHGGVSNAIGSINHFQVPSTNIDPQSNC